MSSLPFPVNLFYQFTVIIVYGAGPQDKNSSRNEGAYKAALPDVFPL